jgi:hypothetical protein
MAATLSVDPSIKIGAAQRLFVDDSTNGPKIAGYDAAPDGQRFLMSKPVTPSPADATRLVLVQNWLAAVK